MLELLRRAMKYPQEEISLDQFHSWKTDPVTQELHRDLITSLIDQLSDDLPEDSIDRSLIQSHQREGARKMLELLFDWEPESVKQIKEGEADD